MVDMSVFAICLNRLKGYCRCFNPMAEEEEQQHTVQIYVDYQNERVPLVQQEQTYSHFRLGREPQCLHRSSRVILMLFKAIFCSLGLWGHQWWNYFPRVLFVIICAVQASQQLSVDLKCPYFDCSLYHEPGPPNVTLPKGFPETEQTCSTLFSIAALLSYIVFIVCFITSRRKVSPPESMMKDADQTEVILLFVALVVFVSSILSALVLLWAHASDSSSLAYDLPTAITIFLAQWASVNTCNIFAISSFSLSTLAKDTLRRIREVQHGTLDDVIKIHEEMCTVVFNSVSAYSVWFVVHWFTYGAGVAVGIILISEELLENKIDFPTVYIVYICVTFVCFLYMFILPCVCAARITSACAEIYEKINCTTSDDWNEGHPFKPDRRDIALFISYAKDRGCGFKVGRITFNTTLAWFSFFFGFTALLFHFF